MKSIVALALMAVAFSACCGPSHDLLSSQAAPSPVVLADTSAGQLALSVGVNMGGYDASTRDKTSIDVFLQHDGRPVQFIKGEHVDCGGVPLTRFTGSFEGGYSTAAIAGEVMTCAYTTGRHSATFTFRIPQALLVLSPREHERVPHGPNTVISYEGGADNKPWVVAISPNWKAFAKPDTITSNSAMLDTSPLLTGDGSITLTDPNNVPLAGIQGTQFHSIDGSSRRVTSVAVVWI